MIRRVVDRRKKKTKDMSDASVPHVSPILRPKMPELDTIRGIAILMVLLVHAFGTYGSDGLSALPKLFVHLTAFGWAGVNLFFALSGFLITGILLDTKGQPHYYRRFYIRRALRILPACYGCLLLLVVIGRHVLPERTVSWAFIGLSVVYLANMTPLFGVPIQFGVLWSLAVEEHFYLIWPAVVRRLNRQAVGVCAVVIVVAASAARMAAFLLGYSCVAHYTWLWADGLALGALLAVLVRGELGTRRGLQGIALAAFTTGGTLLLLTRFFHTALVACTLLFTAVNLACGGMVAMALLLGSGKYNFVVRRPLLAFFGEVSYGLYLIHMLVFDTYDSLQQYLLPSVPPLEGHFAVMAVRCVVSGSVAVLLADLSRRHFEQPFLNLKDRFASTAKAL